MRFEYVGREVSGTRWIWRTWNAYECQWWPFLFGLADHIRNAYAAGWRLYGATLGGGR